MIADDHCYMDWQTFNCNWYGIANPIRARWFVSEFHQDPNVAVSQSKAESISQRFCGVARTLPIVDEVWANLPHMRAAPAGPRDIPSFLSIE